MGSLGRYCIRDYFKIISGSKISHLPLTAVGERPSAAISGICRQQCPVAPPEETWLVEGKGLVRGPRMCCHPAGVRGPWGAGDDTGSASWCRRLLCLSLSQPSAWARGSCAGGPVMLTVFIYGYSFLTHSFPSSGLMGTDARTMGPLLSHLSLTLILIPDPTHHL